MKHRCDNAKGWDGASSFHVSPKCDNNEGVNVVDLYFDKGQEPDTRFLCDECLNALRLDATQNQYLEKVHLVRRLGRHG